jgi:hypothetical protein
VPALVPYPDVLKVHFTFDVGSDATVGTVLHFAYTGGPPSAVDATALAAFIGGAAGTFFPAVMDTETTLTEVGVTDLTSPTSAFGSAPFTAVGTRTGGILPASTCVLVNLPISRRYRGGKPRAYFPWGTATDLLTPQQWVAASVTNFTFALQSFLTAVVGHTEGTTVVGDVVNISYYEGFTVVTNPITGRARNVAKPRTVAIAPDPVLDFTINTKPGNQRRRYLR